MSESEAIEIYEQISALQDQVAKIAMDIIQSGSELKQAIVAKILNEVNTSMLKTLEQAVSELEELNQLTASN